MRWSRAAAATDHIQPTILKEDLVVARHILRRLVVSAHSVRKTGIAVHVHEALHALRQLINKRRHVLRSQGAVQSNAHGLGMADTGIEGFAGLARQGPATLVDQRAAHKDGNVQTAELQVLPDSIQRRLGIQSIENGLHHQDVGTTIHQANDLLEVSVHQLVEGDISRRRILHGWRDRARPVGRSNCTDHETGLGRILSRYLVAYLPSEPGAFVVQLVHIVLHLIVRHGNRRRAERVGTNQVRSALLEVLAVNALNDMRLGDGQHVVVALDVAAPILESVAAVFFLLQLIPLRVVLDHGAHRTIVDGNLGRKQRRDVLTQTVSTTDKVRERFRIKASILSIVDVHRVLRRDGRLGPDGSDLLVRQLRVEIRVGHVILGSLRRRQRRLHGRLGRDLVVVEFDSRVLCFRRWWCHL